MDSPLVWLNFKQNVELQDFVDREFKEKCTDETYDLFDVGNEMISKFV